MPSPLPSPDGSKFLQSCLDGLEGLYGKTRFIPRFDPLEELICCILSQSSSDTSSFPAFTRLRAAYADWFDMAMAPPDDIALHIKAAGLVNQKTKAIQGCLKEIELRTGRFSLEPLRAMNDDEAFGWLTSLPGVGHKTASIVLCFSFGRPAIPVDTHVLRVSKRLGLVDQKANDSKAHKALMSVVNKEDAWRFHILLIQHGRTLCKAPNPLCHRCPISECPSRTRA